MKPINLNALGALLLAGAPMLATAQQISIDDAMGRADSFLSERNNSSRRGAAGRNDESASLTLVYTAKQGDEVQFYVFDRGNNQGFIIMGGDERAHEVLGYSDHGSFDIDNLPPAMRDMLDYYQADIHHAIENNYVPASSASKAGRRGVAAASARQDVDAMIKTKWNQYEPFNNAIPVLKDCTSESSLNGTKMYTGCTATATAQIMKYWNYPSQGTGSHSYKYKPEIGNKVYSDNEMEFSADFGATTYKWSDMLNDYSTGSPTSAQNAAVATLMYHVGVSCDMNYGILGSPGSGASTYNAAKGMMTYFKYPKTMQYLQRNLFLSDDEWEEYIYNELAAGRPVLYNGSSSSAGHAFVCHGYDASNNTFAINWGWGGYQDDYFVLTGTNALTPGSKGAGGGSGADGYSRDQCAITGITTAQSANVTSYAYISNYGSQLELNNYSANLTGTSVEAKYTQEVRLVNTSLRFSDIYLDGLEAIGIQLTNTQGKVYYIEASKDQIKTDNGSCYVSYISINIPKPTVLPNGSYTFRPVYKKTASDDWMLFHLPVGQSAPTLVVNSPSNYNDYLCTKVNTYNDQVTHGPGAMNYFFVYAKSLTGDVTGTPGLRIINKTTGKTTIVAHSKEVTLTATEAYTTVGVDVYNIADGDGTYEAQPLFKPSGASDWVDMYAPNAKYGQFTLTGYQTPTVGKAELLSFSSTTESSLTTESNKTFKVKMKSTPIGAYQGPNLYVSFKFVCGSDTYYSTLSTTYQLSSVGWTYGEKEMTVNPANVLKAGTYQLIPVCRESESDPWVEMYLSDCTPLSVTVTLPEPEHVHVNPAIYGYSIDSNISGRNAEFVFTSNGDERYMSLIDGDKSTKWCIPWSSWPMNFSVNGTSYTNYHPFIQIGMDKAYVLTHYQLTEGGDTNEHPNRNWATWEVYGSNDQTSWVKISEESDPTKTLFRTSDDKTETQYTSTYEVDNTKTAYQYYMFVIGDLVGAEGTNSYVMQMAELNLYGYDPTVKVPGDLSGDKQVDSTDLTNLKAMVVGTKTATEAADVNQDGKKDISDVTTLIHIMGKK